MYPEALAEQARRKGKGLVFDTTIEVIRQAAITGRYISYGEVAEASGAEWNKVRHAMGPHLDSLLEYCHLNDLPLLSAIVVNKPNLNSGELEPELPPLLQVAALSARTWPSAPRLATTHRALAYVCRKYGASRLDAFQPALSGNSPGIQREASLAGKARRSGARELSDISTSRSIRADVTRRAWRCFVPRIEATSLRGNSPR